MSNPSLPPADDERLATDDDTLPPEHPAGSEAAGSAGEVLSGEGLGTSGAVPADVPHPEPTRDRAPGDDS
jgi:hypothetical protein